MSEDAGAASGPRDGSGGVRIHRVDVLTRVEGEGRFTLRLRDGAVEAAELAIFEAPRFFEAFLRGRAPTDVPDIVPRICGICPIAYQMSACVALEQVAGLELDARTWRLRRLLYCGEWMASHALHVFMLHLPDYLGHPGAIEMAAEHRDLVERGLAVKRAGNALIELLGGRASHPVSPCLGGFTRAPRRSELAKIRGELDRALEIMVDTTAWTSTLPAPELDAEPVFVALDPPPGTNEYPLERGERILVTGREPVPVEEWEAVFVESQVPHSNALHCRLSDGTPYLCGPQARLAHHAEKLHPTAREALAASGLSVPVTNPYRSIVVRCVELVHAFAEALDLIDAYQRPEPSRVEVPPPELEPRPGTGFGATEAPRGLLWHRYDVGANGLIERARIVPPTSQNQARIEADLVALAPQLLAVEHDEATRRAEQLIRAYDPCISCATHFLDLRVEELDARHEPRRPGAAEPGAGA